MRVLTTLIALFTVCTLGLASGCKKSEPKKDPQKAEEPAPAEPTAEQKEPAPEPTAAEAAAKADVVAAKGDVVAQPKADVVAMAPETVADATPVAGDVKAAPVPAGGTAVVAKAGEAGTVAVVEGAKPVEGDVTSPADTAAPAADSPHWGQKFALDAIMVTSDLVGNPEHYSQFPNIKVRGQVLAFKDTMVLVGTKTTEGLWVFAVRLEAVPTNQKVQVGQMLFLEGKMEKEGWTLDLVDGAKLKEDKSVKATYDWILAARAGEFEEKGPGQ